mgnify:CR=1 FL=1
MAKEKLVEEDYEPDYFDGDSDLQHINVVKEKTKTLDFFDRLNENSSSNKGKGFFKWLDEQLVKI